MKLHDGTDIQSGASEHLQGNCSGAADDCVVEQMTNMLHGMQPQVRRHASVIHDVVGPSFDGLTALLCRILVLVVRLALPVANAQVTQDVLCLVAD